MADAGNLRETLDDGEVPQLLLFSGTVFTPSRDGGGSHTDAETGKDQEVRR